MKQEKLCGTRVYNATNCNNKIRKVASNKFEKITLLGKHAFSYSVITENKITKELKEVIFPNRNSATCFFTLTVNKYKQ